MCVAPGHGVFCIDLKTWSGSASAQIETRVKAQQQNFGRVSVEQLPDALQAITVSVGFLAEFASRFFRASVQMFVCAGENQQPLQSHEALRAGRPSVALHSQDPLALSGVCGQ